MSRYLDDIETAAAILGTANRVLVIGCSGSGKSTLAQALAATFRIPYISMDRDVFWLPGWQQRPRSEALAIVERIVAQPQWIMDGTSPGTLPLRLPRTDIVLWMRPPRRVSLFGVIARWGKYRGTTRAEMAPGCPERLTMDFLRYIWDFEKTESPEIEQKLADYGPGVPVLVIRSREQTSILLGLLKQALPALNT